MKWQMSGIFVDAHSADTLVRVACSDDLSRVFCFLVMLLIARLP
jgi:hypothetical protein